MTVYPKLKGYLESVAALVKEPVTKLYLEELSKSLEHTDSLEDTLKKEEAASAYLSVPEVLDNPLRKKLSFISREFVKNVIQYSFNKDAFPFTAQQSLVDAKNVSMDFHKMEILHQYSLTWIKE